MPERFNVKLLIVNCTPLDGVYNLFNELSPEMTESFRAQMLIDRKLGEVVEELQQEKEAIPALLPLLSQNKNSISAILLFSLHSNNNELL